MKWLKYISTYALLMAFLLCMLVSGIPHAHHKHGIAQADECFEDSHDHEESAIHNAIDLLNDMSKRHAHNADTHFHDLLKTISNGIRLNISLYVIKILFTDSEPIVLSHFFEETVNVLPLLYQGIDLESHSLRGPPTSFIG
ncbi:hypothetical protein EMN47_16750 [Prolixibacteraceae bacterium JC049]|nr:hypothetical protein [Prolixibacteraceae bacterium JC049]